MAASFIKALFVLASAVLVNFSVAMRSSAVSLHETNEAVVHEQKAQSSMALNKTKLVFPCPLQYCSECCESDSWFGGSAKFKCVLKKSYEFPRGRICKGRTQRASSPGQYKADCELTQEESQMYEKPGKCSKKTKCCCSKDKLSVIEKYSYSFNGAVCAPDSGKFRKVHHTHEGRSVDETLIMVEDTIDTAFADTAFAGLPQNCAAFGELVRYRRHVDVYGGQCLTNLKGLEAVGEKYECPENMFETDPKSVQSHIYGNTKCFCDDDC